MLQFSNMVLPFEPYLKYISEEYRAHVIAGLNEIPDYFFWIAPSSTGKYHPNFDHGFGGLIRHVIMTLKIALDLIRADFLGQIYTQRDIDIIFIALLFHDAIKYGNPCVGHTTHQHPLDSADFCHQYVTNGLDIDYEVCQAIRSHMGKWTTKEDSTIVLPKPVTNIDHLVHMADYIASRTYIMYEPDIKE